MEALLRQRFRTFFHQTFRRKYRSPNQFLHQNQISPLQNKKYLMKPRFQEIHF